MSSFYFEAPGVDKFTCDLKCMQCSHISASKKQCKRRVCSILPYCWQHLQMDVGLKVAKSRIPVAGKGLFAMKLFKKGDIIAKYNGELVSEAVLDKRYGDFTAPYGMQIGNKFVDSACQRYVAAYANHMFSNNKTILNPPDPNRGPSDNRKRSYVGKVNIRVEELNGDAYFVATQNIYPGQEIYINYGNDYQFGEAGVSTGTRKKRYSKK